MAKTRRCWCPVTYMIFMAIFMYKEANSYEQRFSWMMYANVNGFRPINGTSADARSPVQCGALCTSKSYCLSFFYTPNEYNGCQLMTQFFSSTTGFIVSPSSKYFGPVADNYDTVVLSDGTRFRYRLGQNPVNNAQAEANCTSDGGHLVRITSAAKLDFLRTVITPGSASVSRVCTDTLSTKYLGHLQTTVAGDTCQRWDSDIPHPHSHDDPTDFPEGVTADAANYCRDPDQSDKIWCMTTNVDQEWDWCLNTDCSGFTDVPTDSCYLSGNSVNYAGTWSVTKYNRSCQRWDTQSPNAHGFTSAAMFPDATVSDAANYCRDPDNKGYTWCFTNDIKSPWEPCYILDCLKDIPERKCYDHPSTQAYTGTWNLTSSGLVCQIWDTTYPHSHTFQDVDFPDATKSDAGNYCRDPDNRGYLWCYTTDYRTETESCDIPQCDGSEGYHVQGTNLNAVNEWRVSNGETIELSSWAAGKPDYPDQEHCARMDSKSNWNLNDGDCSWPFLFICEK